MYLARFIVTLGSGQRWVRVVSRGLGSFRSPRASQPQVESLTVDVVVMVRSEFGDGQRHSEFFMMPLVGGRNGHQAAQQAFVRLHHSGGEVAEVAGLELSLSFVDFVPPAGRRPPPLEQQQSGAVDILTEQQLAARIVQLASLGNAANPCTLHRVTMQSMRYRDVDLARVVLDGECSARHSIEIAGVAKAKQPKDSKQASRKRDMCADLLEEDVAEARKSRAGKQGQAARAGGATHSGPQSVAEVGVAEIREAMRELGLADHEISIDDFCKVEGLLSAVFSALPAREQAAVVAAEVEAKAFPCGDGVDDASGASSSEDQGDALSESDGCDSDGADGLDASGAASGSADAAPLEWPWTVLDVVGLLRFADKATGRFAGALHWMGNASLKATCGIKDHGKCGCWVTLRGESPDLRALEAQLTEWIAHGVSDSKQEHAQRSVDIRIGFGVRVRRKAG